MHPSSALVIMLSAAGVLAVPSSNGGRRVHLRAASEQEGHLARGFARAVSLPRALSLDDIVKTQEKCMENCQEAHRKELKNIPDSDSDSGADVDYDRDNRHADAELVRCEDECNDTAEEERKKYNKENGVDSDSD
ncbi:Uu.00g095450.m01.CDS01 [Anthostomella pinea]|uniref:Uu.00g095450.m01.CDS01 n=1 Tax=Anthostomella pinea TaxID=933095 RepID=A0AAI8VD13_9PEZI|nr:Uu.00g095450.m01.CDS01 [Anthostomella pinea]